MKKYFFPKFIGIAMTAVLLLSLALPAQELMQQSGIEGLVGEQLPRSDIGPGYVESMEAALARDSIREITSHSDSVDPGPHHGIWKVPSRGASYYPYSGEHYA